MDKNRKMELTGKRCRCKGWNEQKERLERKKEAEREADKKEEYVNRWSKGKEGCERGWMKGRRGGGRVKC